jgi:hypothetical protein
LSSFPTSSVIVELLFSQMKNIQEANQTSESVDQELTFIFNVLHEGREQRRALLDHYKSGGGKHLHTKEQIMKLCEQALASLPRYSADAMAAVPARRSFSCTLTDTDRATANHCQEIKNERKAKSRSAAESEAEQAARLEEVHATPLAVEVAEAALLSITHKQRLFAVVMEEKITGQVNGEAAFWSKVPSGPSGVFAEVKRIFPFITSMIQKWERKNKASLLKADKKTTSVVIKRWLELVFDEHTGKAEWVATTARGPKTVAVHTNAQVVHGLVRIVRSLRSFLFSRESPWKPGTGPVEGQVSCMGKVQRGAACSRCLRDPNCGTSSPPAPPTRLQHWGSVACFLDLGDLQRIGWLLFCPTRSTGTNAARVAVERQG